MCAVCVRCVCGVCAECVRSVCDVCAVCVQCVCGVCAECGGGGKVVKGWVCTQIAVRSFSDNPALHSTGMSDPVLNSNAW